MANIFVDPAVSNSSPVIRVGTGCFFLVGDSTTAIDTFAIDDVFADCPGCELCKDLGDCTGHTGSPGVAPSIIFTIFDADYAGGNITWCNVTWTPAEIQTGESKCICPNRYRLFNTPLLTNTVPQYGLSNSNKETWAFDGVGIGAFFMDRFLTHYSIFPSVPTHWYRFFNMRVQNNAAPPASDRNSRYQQSTLSGGVLQPVNTFTQNEMAMGWDVGNAAYNAAVYDYKIHDIQFGNFTDANGVNWKWERGANWT